METSHSRNTAGPARKRRSDEASLAPASKHRKPELENDAVCELCEKVDVVALFTSKHKQVRLGPLSHLDECTTCPLCNHIATKLKQSPRISNNPQSVQLKLVQVEVPKSQYVRKFEIEKTYQIDVKINTDNGAHLICSIEICDGSPVPRYPNARTVRKPIPGRFRPTVLLEWLAGADETNDEPHGQERSFSSDSMKDLILQRKFRALDVRTGEVVALDSPAPFVALSYVWGHFKNTERRKVRSDSSRSSRSVVWVVDIDSQPATIRDAASLVRELGQKYLWIDAICIDQSDPTDKGEIVSKMDAIYGAAYLTIVAADGEDSNAGLRRLKPDPRYPERPINVRVAGKLISFLDITHTYESALRETVWNTRGWTYQEMMLSRTVVVFTDEQVFFHSRGHRERESCTLMRSHPPSDSGSSEVSSQRRRTAMKWTPEELVTIGKFSTQLQMRVTYNTAVQNFTERFLTYHEDRLDAFRGVLNGLVPNEQSALTTYALSGLAQWGPLDWMINGPTHRIRHDASGRRALPSWSWVGWSGAVLMNHVSVDKWAATLSAMDANNVKVDINGGKPWPEEPSACKLDLKDGIVLHLWAPLLRCRLIKMPAQSSNPHSACSSYEIRTVHRSSEETLGSIELQDASFAPDKADSLYDFVHLPGEHYRYALLVTRCGESDFVERLGISILEGSQNSPGDIFGNYQHFKIL